MRKISIKGMGKLTSEQVSSRVLYVLVSLAAVVFCLFFLVGYDIPFDKDPTFNAPLLTDAVLLLIAVLVVLATFLAVCSVVSSVRRRDKSSSVVNNIPAAKISWFTVLLFVTCMVVTFSFGSSEPVNANGVKFNDVFWLKATDMFIDTSVILLVLAAIGVGIGISGYFRNFRMSEK